MEAIVIKSGERIYVEKTLDGYFQDMYTGDVYSEDELKF